VAKGYQGKGEQVNLLFQPRQPLLSILNFGLVGNTMSRLELNLTSLFFVIYHP
jgi:hypothetical protein